MLRNYTIGSAPELFLINKKTGKVVSAIDKIPGSKDAPYKDDMPEGFGLQKDNFLADFNIPAVKSERMFVDCINFMKDIFRMRAQEIDPNLDIKCMASAKVPAKELKHPQAKEAGCDPDYCIYTEGPNPPGNLTRTNLSSAGQVM